MGRSKKTKLREKLSKVPKMWRDRTGRELVFYGPIVEIIKLLEERELRRETNRRRNKR